MADISIAKGAPEAESANQHGLPVGGNIRGEAEQLRNEVTRLRAALRDETNGRRRHRRFPGNGATAVLATPGHLVIAAS